MAGQIYVTGDCHGDFRRFNTTNFPDQRSMDKDDFVIICGDAAFTWSDSKETRYWNDWMTDKPFTTLYADGNHENFDQLYALPVQRWNGGHVHFITPSIIHLMRGQVFTIAGRRIFAFGGAQSHDIEDGILDMNDPQFHEKRIRLRKRGARYRIDHLNWWKEELPSEAEYAEGLRNLDACGWEVDYIITHAGPTSVASQISPDYGATLPERWLEQIRQKCRCSKWLFGHYHENRYITAGDIALYDKILRLE